MVKEKYCVYKHTNKSNGKMYIGITSQAVEVRWKKGFGYRYCPAFWRAIEKYGWDGFEHEIIISECSKEEAENFERELIAKYNTSDEKYGYNISLGGSVKGKCNEITKSKISAKLKGRKFSNETIKKMSDSAKGRKFTEKQIAKMRVAQLGEKHHRAKAVYQIDEKGNVISRFGCIREAARETGIQDKNINKVCLGQRNMAGGYHWEYVIKEEK